MLIILVLFIYLVSYVESGSKILIDNDAGADDAMAIFLALLNEKHLNGPKLIGLTTGNGNTKEENVYINNQRILKVAKRQDVPIFRGSKASLVTTPYAGDYFGGDGLGDIDEVFTDLVPARKEGAVSALIEFSKTYKDDLTVITLGALTNVALAITLDDNFLGRLKHLYVGAGHVHSDENPGPEFNAKMDAEAYRVIAKHATPDKVTVLPFSQVMAHLNISRQWREDVFGAINSDIVRAQNLYERITLPLSDRWHALDPAVVGVALRPELVEKYEYSKNDIVLCGDKRGSNTNTFVDRDDANVRIIYSIKMEEYKQYLLDLFSVQ